MLPPLAVASPTPLTRANKPLLGPTYTSQINNRFEERRDGSRQL
ncbi:MAG: hypothetical protein PUP91_08075 [Rhizonema sp. PD37]|nr:hypothetical protein [Rhizonema sp. PD37]